MCVSVGPDKNRNRILLLKNHFWAHLGVDNLRRGPADDLFHSRDKTRVPFFVYCMSVSGNVLSRARASAPIPGEIKMKRKKNDAESLQQMWQTVWIGPILD